MPNDEFVSFLFIIIPIDSHARGKLDKFASKLRQQLHCHLKFWCGPSQAAWRRTHSVSCGQPGRQPLAKESRSTVGGQQSCTFKKHLKKNYAHNSPQGLTLSQVGWPVNPPHTSGHPPTQKQRRDKSGRFRLGAKLRDENQTPKRPKICLFDTFRKKFVKKTKFLAQRKKTEILDWGVGSPYFHT